MGEQAEWWREPRRLIQTNLREIDVLIDPADLIAELGAYHADTALINVGGIVANYPTDLDFHFRNPHLRGDFVGEVLERCHAAGMKVIGRFDFSRVNRALADRHPEWLYVREDGAHLDDNGQQPTCINGAYRNRCSFAILDEVIARYCLDGFFFNMPGPAGQTYDRIHHGRCYCACCRRRFRERFGREIPPNAVADPDYHDWIHSCVGPQFARLRDHVRRRCPEAMLMTYTPEVDVVRGETNTDFDRAQPEYRYTSAIAQRTFRRNWDRPTSNTAVYFAGFQARHTAVSPAQVEEPILAAIAHGAWADCYVIGTLGGQTDRAALPRVEQWFRFYREHREVYADTESAAEVAVVRPDGVKLGGAHEDFLGTISLLTQAGLSYDVLVPGAALATEGLERYRLICAPSYGARDERFHAALEAWSRAGGRLLLSGAAVDDRFVGIERAGVVADTKGLYLERDGCPWPELAESDLLMLRHSFVCCWPQDDGRGEWRFVSGAMYGPPEKCYVTETTDHPGLVVRPVGAGTIAWLPWQLARHYHEFPLVAHEQAWRGCLRRALAYEPTMCVTAPPHVEVTHLRKRDGSADIFSLVNRSGQLGRGSFDPLPLYGICIGVPPGIARVEALVAGRELEVRDGVVRLPVLESFESLVFQAEPGDVPAH